MSESGELKFHYVLITFRLIKFVKLNKDNTVKKTEKKVYESYKTE